MRCVGCSIGSEMGRMWTVFHPHGRGKMRAVRLTHCRKSIKGHGTALAEAGSGPPVLLVVKWYPSAKPEKLIANGQGICIGTRRTSRHHPVVDEP